MKVHDTSFVLMVHLPYSIHTSSMQDVYEYDIYMLVPSSQGKVSALGQQMHNQKSILILLNENIGISFLFNIVTYDVY